MTRALVVYESMFGNTKDIATAIADGLSQRVPTTVLPVDIAPRVLPSDVGLLVVGGPTHAFSLSRSSTREDAVRRGQAAGRPTAPQPVGLREWLRHLGRVPRTVAAATFDTKARTPRLPGSAARAARKRLGLRGVPVVAPPQTFYVEGTLGPLLPGERQRARAWGFRLGQTLAMTREMSS